MSWHYSPDGKEHREVPDAEFHSLVREGTIRPDTLVWREGMTGWKPAGSVAPELFSTQLSTAPPPVPPDASLSVPSSSGQWSHPPGMMLPIDSGATLSLICGISGVVAGASGFCCCFGSAIGAVFGLTAVIYGHSSLSRISAFPDQVRGRECAIAGLVTGYLSLALTIGAAVLTLLGVGFSALTSAPWFHHP
jgi:hypothetical protein